MPPFRTYGRTPPRTEKDEERAGDKLMSMLGFTVWRFSQPRATKQSIGIPDRLYTNAARGIVVYWEAKRPGGRQRDGQKRFEVEITACGIPYVLGPCDALLAWCKSRGLIL